MGVYTRNLLESRSQRINSIPIPTKIPGPLLYWMSRDQRVKDNFALFYAQELAIRHKQPLLVLFNFDYQFPNFNSRNASFMIKNLELVDRSLRSLNILMIITSGPIAKIIPSILEEYGVSVLVTDFSPLKIKKKWHQEILEIINIPFIQVVTSKVVWVFKTRLKEGH